MPLGVVNVACTKKLTTSVAVDPHTATADKVRAHLNDPNVYSVGVIGGCASYDFKTRPTFEYWLMDSWTHAARIGKLHQVFAGGNSSSHGDPVADPKGETVDHGCQEVIIKQTMLARALNSNIGKIAEPLGMASKDMRMCAMSVDGERAGIKLCCIHENMAGRRGFIAECLVKADAVFVYSGGPNTLDEFKRAVDAGLDVSKCTGVSLGYIIGLARSKGWTDIAERLESINQ